VREIYLQIIQNPVQTKKDTVSSPLAYSAFCHKKYFCIAKGFLIRLTRMKKTAKK